MDTNVPYVWYPLPITGNKRLYHDISVDGLVDFEYVLSMSASESDYRYYRSGGFAIQCVWIGY